MYKLINLKDKTIRIDQRIKSEMMNLNTKYLEKKSWTNIDGEKELGYFRTSINNSN
jgi:hypothetical protein